MNNRVNTKDMSTNKRISCRKWQKCEERKREEIKKSNREPILLLSWSALFLFSIPSPFIFGFLNDHNRRWAIIEYLDHNFLECWQSTVRLLFFFLFAAYESCYWQEVKVCRPCLVMKNKNEVRLERSRDRETKMMENVRRKSEACGLWDDCGWDPGGWMLVGWGFVVEMVMYERVWCECQSVGMGAGVWVGWKMDWRWWWDGNQAGAWTIFSHPPLFQGILHSTVVICWCGIWVICVNASVSTSK